MGSERQAEVALVAQGAVAEHHVTALHQAAAGLVHRDDLVLALAHRSARLGAETGREYLPVIDHFVGRTAELKTLNDFLARPREANRRPAWSAIVLTGLGGAGKSALLAQFMRDMIEPSFPPAELKDLAILDINGTKDEAINPKIVDAHREVMEPYSRRYRVARVEGFQHYLYKQDNIKVVGNLWLRFIESGYFDK